MSATINEMNGRGHTSVRKAKRYLLRMCATLLGNNDDLMPEGVDDGDPEEYARWGVARDELIKEFGRRSAEPSSVDKEPT